VKMSSDEDSDDPFECIHTRKFRHESDGSDDESDESIDFKSRFRARRPKRQIVNLNDQENKQQVEQVNGSEIIVPVVDLDVDVDVDIDIDNSIDEENVIEIESDDGKLDISIDPAEEEEDSDIEVVMSPLSSRRISSEGGRTLQEALRKTRAARQALLQTQVAPTNFQQLDNDDDVEVQCLDSLPRQKHQVPKGEPISVSLRSNNKLHNISTYTQISLQQVHDEYCNRVFIPLHKNVILHFDGEALDLTKTPQQYDMEDGDLIDVVLKDATENSFPTKKIQPDSARTPAKNTTPGTFARFAVSLHTQIFHCAPEDLHRNVSTSTRTWQIRKTDKLAKLVDQYKAERNLENAQTLMRYTNNKGEVRSVNLERDTPLLLQLKDYATLDMYVYGNSPSTTGSVVQNNSDGNFLSLDYEDQCKPAKRIDLILRINGQDSTKMTFSLAPNDPFSKLLEEFRSKHSSHKHVQLTLDGEPLSLQSTCQNEDLEGGEIVDVVAG